MRDLHYWKGAYGEYPREPLDYILLGCGALTSLLWGPFYLLGRLVAAISGLLSRRHHV